jgi:hypothetical protein
MATYRDDHDDALDREEQLEEDLENILNEIPVASHGWTPALGRALGWTETDDDGNVLPDPDRCYNHVDCENPYCYPASVVLSSEEEAYTAELEILRDQVTRLVTNVTLVEMLAQFPATFYARGEDAWHAWAIETHYVSAVMMAWRLWKDDDQRSLTLPQFRARVIRTAHVKYRPEIQARLKARGPEKKEGPALDRIHDVRNQRIGHLSRAVQLGTLPADWPSVDDLRAVSKAYAEFLDALMFRDSQHWPAEAVIHSLEFHLTEVALSSDWSRLYDDDRATWDAVLAPKLAEMANRHSCLADLNRRRAQHQLPPIEWHE